MKASSLAIYAEEKAAGTEMPAIVGAIREHIETEEERLRLEWEERRRRQLEEERVALEQRFLSGADCKWTRVNGSQEVYCRINGRAFRLAPTKDKMCDVHRIVSIDDPRPGWIGKYRTRGEATKALSQIAYQPEPRW